jgi:DNA-binding IclR family transcriptional regulator
MIQIIDKVFNILDIISEGEKLQLKDIAERSGIKKTALSNILKSLADAKVIEKVDGNKYRIGSRLTPIAHPRMNKSKFIELAEEAAQVLTSKINEAVLISVLFEGDRYLAANSNASRSVTVEPDFNKRPSTFFYGTATGRILLAFSDNANLGLAIKKNGLPGSKWNNIHTLEELQKALEPIRTEKLCILPSEDNEAVSLAVPVFAADGRLAAALGVRMPSHRFTGEHKEAVLTGMQNAGERMGNAMKIFNVAPL